MTARPGLFVMEFSAALGKDIGKTKADDARLALTSLLQDPTKAGIVYTPNKGNLAVTGRSGGPNMVYRVADGNPATLRSAASGLYLWSNDGPVDVDSGTPAPGSGSRVDLIWAWGRDGSTGGPDADSTPQFGVTVGASAASNPTKPYASVPDGALVLAEAVVAAGNADATAAVITMVAPYKVATGAPQPVRSQAERDALTGNWTGRRVVRLDKGGAIDTFDGTQWIDWVDLARAAGVGVPSGGAGLKYRLRGAECDIAIDVTGSFAAGFSALSATGALPAAARPSLTPARGVAYTGSGTAMGSVEVLTTGTVNVQVPAGTAGVAKALFTFPTG